MMLPNAQVLANLRSVVFLRQGASASSQTADKVRKAAAELGYRPNSLARAMVSGKTGIIGLVVIISATSFILRRWKNYHQNSKAKVTMSWYS